MSKIRSERLFNIGDTVQVVSTPYLECPLSWVSQMTKYCGMEMTVSDVLYSEAHGVWAYYLKDCAWCWCENCFEYSVADIKESDADISDLFL